MKFLKKIPFDLFYEKRKEFFYWFLLACVCSILIHFLIIKKIGPLEVSSFDPSSFDKFIPRKFKIENVSIDPKLLEEPKKEEVVLLKPGEVSFSEENNKISNETLPQEAPKCAIVNINEQEEKKIGELNDSNIINQDSSTPAEAPISLDSQKAEKKDDLKNIADSSVSNNHYSKLDDLIEEKEPLSSKTAPILLPTDLLFEYNADQLKPDAEKSLEKLALLIQRNPKAKFIIEGFTDSFGSPEYNLDLSNRRANSIKEWLIKKQFVNEYQIEAYGLGKTHFIVSPTGNIEQQQLNRRVEIVIKSN